MHLKEERVRNSVYLHTKISVTSLRQATSFPCGVRDSEYTQSLGCSNRRSSVKMRKRKRKKVDEMGRDTKRLGNPSEKTK